MFCRIPTAIRPLGLRHIWFYSSEFRHCLVAHYELRTWGGRYPAFLHKWSILMAEI
jgi:hypothetical protein